MELAQVAICQWIYFTSYRNAGPLRKSGGSRLEPISSSKRSTDIETLNENTLYYDLSNKGKSIMTYK